MIYKYPVNYGNVDSSASGYSVELPNFLYYGVERNRVNEVDGWGTLITPSGTYNVLRLKSTIEEHDSIYLDTLGFGYGFDVPTQTRPALSMVRAVTVSDGRPSAMENARTREESAFGS